MDFVKNHAFIYKHFSLLNNKYFEETTVHWHLLIYNNYTISLVILCE